jgi:site-specific recombinase XerD
VSNRQAIKQKNEKIKRRYLEYKTEAEGFSKQSILALEKALWKYDDCTWFEDYAKFNNQTAQKFKKYLSTKINEQSKQMLGLRSQYHHLRHIKDFFTWLSGQPGYKSRIKLSDVMYLQLSKKDRQQATSSGLPSYPTLEQVKALCSFTIENEIDNRDRALIAFTSLTGIRDQALVTLRVGCFDKQSGMLKQLPSRGVQTKFNKEIFTTMLKIDDDLYN